MSTTPPQSDQNQDFPAGCPASPFSIKEVWTLTQGRRSFGALDPNSGKAVLWGRSHHLLCLPALRIKSLFLAPTPSFWVDGPAVT